MDGKGWLSMLRDRQGDLTLPIVILTLAVFFGVAKPVFLSPGNLTDVSRQGAVLAILAFGQALVVIARGLDLSVGANMAVVSVFSAVLAKEYGTPVGDVAMLLVGIAIGAMNGMLVARFGMTPLIVTLAMLSVLRSIAMIQANGLVVSSVPDDFSWLGTAFIGPLPVPTWVGIVVFLVCLALLRSTPFGVHVYATGDNPQAARLSGLNPSRVLFTVFVINGFLAALGGVLLTSRVNSGQPQLAVGFELQVLAAVFLGGIALSGGQGSLFQVLYSVILLTILGNGLNLLGVQSYVQLVVSGIILVGSIGFQRVLSARRTGAPRGPNGRASPTQAEARAG